MFKNSEGELQIEDGVLDALLRTGSYRHAQVDGRLIKMSTSPGSGNMIFMLPPDQIWACMWISTSFCCLRSWAAGNMRIGVTGHINLPDEIGVIKKCLDEAVTFIEEHYPNRLCNVLSMLALGSDRLAAIVSCRCPGRRLQRCCRCEDDFINDFGVTTIISSRIQMPRTAEFRYYIENRPTKS